MEKYRVQKLLSNYGYCSRRKAEEFIEQGRVTVNGKVISLGDKAAEKDKIHVDGKPVDKERKLYFMFHKPLGYVTALHDKHEKTIMDILPIKERVFPVGRLDTNTSGLLLLTNDGDFTNKITHPRYEIKKTYYVRLNKSIKINDVRKLEKGGIKLEEFTTSPTSVKTLDTMTLEITVHEGKNRIVRRMFEFLGYDVKQLCRIRIGGLELGKLALGKFKKLTDAEKKAIFKRP